jgi:hypothetical protein
MLTVLLLGVLGDFAVQIAFFSVESSDAFDGSLSEGNKFCALCVYGTVDKQRRRER